jgi:RsiW-degrading membrane proteinase PrsW (M82 family)
MIGLRIVQGDQVGPPRDFDRDVVRIGRDPSNDVVLTDAAGVSRHHAELRYAGGEWRVVDLQSSNGTYVGGRRVTDARLRDGDEVQFAPQGPRLRVSLPTTLGDASASARPAVGEFPPTSVGRPTAPRPEAARPEPAHPAPVRAEPPRSAPRPDPPPATPPTDPSESELLPLRMGLDPVSSRGYLVPGLITVGTISALLWTFQSGEVTYSLMITMLFFVTASASVLYMLCGKSKPPGPLVAAGILVAVLVSAGHDVVMAPIKATVLPYIAKQVPVPNQPNTVRLVEPDSVPGKFVYHFFRAALPEELEKITPALIGLYIVLRSRARGRASPLEEQFGVREPLDGIMLGIAGAAGFHFVEAVTYSQEPLAKFAFLQDNAVPLFNQLVQKHGNSAPAILMQRGLDAGLAAAFQVIFRGLSGAVSHLGYSGIFGYYVGLAALRPEHKWRLLLRGFLTAAIVHATWNATSEVGGGIVVPPLAFALLITSIIKARSMSPGRDTNFATALGRRG